MSLEAELLELNGAYQNTVATNLDLRERCAELEMLIQDYTFWAELVAINVKSNEPIPEECWQNKRTLLQRAKELLD